MDVNGGSCSPGTQSEEEMDLRRGPWTIEEDLTLINYIANHGEGRWNSLARCAGLKRTGKSCRLRWLNYLHPDVRRGNITPEEQLLILELHSRWGNRWSKIAQHLPGRTDNEIKNYWRTRVQKHAKQLKCDVNSKKFKDTMRYLWMPRLVERIQAAAASASSTGNTAIQNHSEINAGQVLPPGSSNNNNIGFNSAQVDTIFTPENSSTGASSDSIGTHIYPGSELTDCFSFQANNQNALNTNIFQADHQVCYQEPLISPSGYFNYGMDFQANEQNNMWLGSGDVSENLWNVENTWW